MKRRSLVQSAAAAGLVSLTAITRAARKVESLAINSGPKAVTVPADVQVTLTKWPRYGSDEKQYLSELLESNKFYEEIPLLENETKAYLGVPFVKAHINGTSALMSMFFALDLPEGTEIMTPSYTASATIAPMRFFGYVPIFVDIDPRTACLDLNDAKRKLTPHTKAIVPMHAWGLPCDMDQICAWAKETGLVVLEDAAQAQGATLQGKHMGTWGHMGIFSFQMSKVLPAVEGGMGVYQDRERFERATTFGNYDLPGRFPADSKYRKYDQTGFGPKFRIHPLAAALARRQMLKLDERNALIASQVRRLNERLSALPGLLMQRIRADVKRVHWAANILFLDEKKAGFSKSALLTALKAEGVRASGAAYPEQHKFALYREARWWHHAPQVPDDLPGCTEVNRTTVRLPLFTAEATEVIDQYAEAFEKVWAHREAVAKL
jgi:dTDP-4-amino-4,6-dideoxygalactose transaminase